MSAKQMEFFARVDAYPATYQEWQGVARWLRNLGNWLDADLEAEGDRTTYELGAVDGMTMIYGLVFRKMVQAASDPCLFLEAMRPEDV